MTKFMPAAALCAVSIALTACTGSETTNETAEAGDAAAAPAAATPAAQPVDDDPDASIAVSPDGAEMQVDGDDVDLSVSTADPTIEAEVER